MNTPLKKLYACLNKEKNETFFASMVDQKGTMSEMRSSFNIQQGDILQLVPVEEDWDETPFQPGDISGSKHVMEGNVTRVEGRGVFYIRMLSFEEQDIVNQVRTGQISKDNLKIETSDAGLIRTVTLQGRIAMESAAKIKSYVQPKSPEQNMFLLDFSGVSYMEKNSMTMLYLAIKESWQNNNHFSILLKSNSSIEEFLQSSKIKEIAGIFTNRDEAVAALLSRNLT